MWLDSRSLGWDLLKGLIPLSVNLNESEELEGWLMMLETLGRQQGTIEEASEKILQLWA